MAKYDRRRPKGDDSRPLTGSQPRHYDPMALDSVDDRPRPRMEEIGPGMRLAQIGAAVIGTGFIGTVHVEALRRIGVQVRGVLGSTPERGAARALALGVPKAYDSLEAMLADPAVDVVHVTSPNHLHVPQASAVLASGRHVVCEKPLAMTASESAGLVEQAAESGKVAAVNYNIRFYPLNQHLRELVESGGLGEIRFVTGHYFQDWLFHESDWNWRLEPGQGGSLRAVGDIGSHWLDLMTTISGQRIVSGHGRPGHVRAAPT